MQDRRGATILFMEEDVVEVFIDPFGEGTTYYEFEVSPRGVLFER